MPASSAPNKSQQAKIQSLLADDHSPERISEILNIKLESVKVWCDHFSEKTAKKEAAPAAPKVNK